MSDRHTAFADADPHEFNIELENENAGDRADENLLRGDQASRQRGQTNDREGDAFGGRRAKRRIDQLTGRWRHAEDRAQQLERENAELRRQTLQQGQGRLSAEEARVKAELEQSQHDLQAAIEAGDHTAQAKVHGRIAQLAAAQSTIARDKAQVDHAVARVPETPAQPNVSPAMQAWTAENEWFKADPAMTQAALAFDQDARRRGLVPETPEYFTHIDRKMRTSFPDYFDEGEPARGGGNDPEDGEQVDLDPPARQQSARQPSTAAAPRRNAPAAPGGAALPQRRTIRLTAEQLDMARSMKITPQEYAASLERRRRNGGRP